MADFKLVISDPKSGKSVQKELKEPDSERLMGGKIGDKVSGDEIGFPGYEFKLTGGSDYCGFPMRYDVSGTQRKRILSTSTKGNKIDDPGIRKRKTLCGNTVHARISQINLKIEKSGSQPLFEEKPAEAKSD